MQIQHRIRIPAGEIAPFVSWLPQDPGGQIWCPAFIGLWGQIRLFPEIPREDEELKIRLQEVEIPSEAAAEAGLRYVRHRATYWMVRAAAEAAGTKTASVVARYSFQMPEEARSAGYAPRSGEGAVIFVLGELFEIWRATEWRKHVRETLEDEAAYRESLEGWL